MFKVGDRVRVIRTGKVGSVYTITTNYDPYKDEPDEIFSIYYIKLDDFYILEIASESEVEGV